MRCAARWSTFSQPARSRRSGSISSATRSTACAASTPPTSARPTRPTASLCCRRPKPCSTRRASSASASRYRETFGATATEDPLYQALSEGRRLAGMEHWLPLFEERLATLFDHLGDDDLIVRDAGADQALRGAARGDRRLLRTTASGRGRASPAATARSRPTRSICARSEWDGDRGRPADPPRHALPRARIRPTSSISTSSRPAISRPSARSRPMSTRRSPSMSAALAQGEPQGRARQLHARRARAARRPARRPWAQGAASWPTAGRRRSARRRSRRCSSCRSITASPRPTSRCSPSRTCSATGWSAGARSARPPTPSSPSWRRSRPAISSSTPITASAATRG